MSEWMDAFTKAASGVERRLDLLKFGLKLRGGFVDPLVILPYLGHGTADELFLKGRVLERKDVRTATEADSVWQNFASMYRRFDSDEVPNAKLRVRCGSQTFDAQGDHEGYFDLHIVQYGGGSRVWQPVEVTLLDPLPGGPPAPRALGHAQVPPADTDFGIISDIDDTIVHTGATDPLTMARVVMLNNPRTRLPFEGVAAFYRALRRGPRGCGYNPIFYVSSSPWNLYDLLIDFLRINNIPFGPLFLRDVGLEHDRLIKSGHLEHKMNQIQTIIETHAALPFVLIGDSGQDDPEIYKEVVRRYPGRIKAIYIRDVTLDERDGLVRKIIKELRDQSVDMLLVPDTVAAAHDAATRGLVAPDRPEKVAAAKARDEQTPTIAEKLVEEVTPEPLKEDSTNDERSTINDE